MKIKIMKEQLASLSPTQWLRRAGYALIYDRHQEQESFSRRFGRDFYPRFHLYVQEVPGENYLFFNLHLDQKKASYEGQSRHSADYDGDLVEAESKRLQSLLGAINEDYSYNSEPDILNSLKANQVVAKPGPKKSFWKKLFS